MCVCGTKYVMRMSLVCHLFVCEVNKSYFGRMVFIFYRPLCASLILLKG